MTRGRNTNSWRMRQRVCQDIIFPFCKRVHYLCNCKSVVTRKTVFIQQTYDQDGIWDCIMQRSLPLLGCFNVWFQRDLAFIPGTKREVGRERFYKYNIAVVRLNISLTNVCRLAPNLSLIRQIFQSWPSQHFVFSDTPFFQEYITQCVFLCQQ